MTTYRMHDKVITPNGSKATYQWPLPGGKCEVWILKDDWKEPEPYPCKGLTAPLIVDVASLKSQFSGIKK